MVWRSVYHDLKPVPPHRWHFIFLSPCLTRPLPSQFLHFTFALPAFFCMFSPHPHLIAGRHSPTYEMKFTLYSITALARNPSLLPTDAFAAGRLMALQLDWKDRREAVFLHLGTRREGGN